MALYPQLAAREQQTFASGYLLGNFVMSAFTSGVTPPAVGSTVNHGFGCNVAFDVSLDGGNSWSHGTASNQSGWMSTYHSSDYTQGGSTTSYFDEEIVFSISASLDHSPWQLMVRESPTRSSLGETVVVDPVPFTYSSFFDVFVEISVDGGQSWSPSNDTLHITTPEPSSLLALMGGLAFAAPCLRRRRQ